MVFDAIIALLLVVTIGYSWRLSKKLSAFKDSKKELDYFVKEFNQAIAHADYSIGTLKTLSKEADENLQDHIEKARFLANDLSFLAHKGDNVANKLEEYIATSHAVDPNPLSLRGVGRLAAPTQEDIAPLPQKTALQQLEHKRLNIRPWHPGEKPPTQQRNLSHSEMSPSKKQALDQVLSQIASKKRQFAQENNAQEAPRHTPATTPKKSAVPRTAANSNRSNVSDVKNSLQSLRAALKVDT